MDDKNNPNSNPTPEKQIPVLTTYEKALQNNNQKKEVSEAREYIISKKTNKPTEQQSKERKSRKTIFVILILLIISVGIYFAIKNIPASFFTKNEAVKTNNDNGVFKIDTIKRVNVDNQSQEELINNIQKNLLGNNENGKITSVELYSTQTDPDTKEKTELNVSSLAFFEQIIEANAPERLLRSIDKKFIFGTFTNNGVNRPFIFLLSTDFQNTFAGMLEWEGTMLNDIDPVFRIIPIIEEKPEGTELTLEERNDRELLTQIDTAKFRDLIINNQDTRTLITENETSLLLYSFINSKFVIIADHPSTLEELKSRVITSQLIRQ